MDKEFYNVFGIRKAYNAQNPPKIRRVNSSTKRLNPNYIPTYFENQRKGFNTSTSVHRATKGVFEDAESLRKLQFGTKVDINPSYLVDVLTRNIRVPQQLPERDHTGALVLDDNGLPVMRDGKMTSIRIIDSFRNLSGVINRVSGSNRDQLRSILKDLILIQKQFHFISNRTNMEYRRPLNNVVESINHSIMRIKDIYHSNLYDVELSNVISDVVTTLKNSIREYFKPELLPSENEIRNQVLNNQNISALNKERYTRLSLRYRKQLIDMLQSIGIRPIFDREQVPTLPEVAGYRAPAVGIPPDEKRDDGGVVPAPIPGPPGPPGPPPGPQGRDPQPDTDTDDDDDEHDIKEQANIPPYLPREDQAGARQRESQAEQAKEQEIKEELKEQEEKEEEIQHPPVELSESSSSSVEIASENANDNITENRRKWPYIDLKHTNKTKLVTNLNRKIGISFYVSNSILSSSNDTLNDHLMWTQDYVTKINLVDEKYLNEMDKIHFTSHRKLRLIGNSRCYIPPPIYVDFSSEVSRTIPFVARNFMDVETNGEMIEWLGYKFNEMSSNTFLSYLNNCGNNVSLIGYYIFWNNLKIAPRIGIGWKWVTINLFDGSITLLVNVKLLWALLCYWPNIVIYLPRDTIYLNNINTYSVRTINKDFLGFIMPSIFKPKAGLRQIDGYIKQLSPSKKIVKQEFQGKGVKNEYSMDIKDFVKEENKIHRLNTLPTKPKIIPAIPKTPSPPPIPEEDDGSEEPSELDSQEAAYEKAEREAKEGKSEEEQFLEEEEEEEEEEEVEEDEDIELQEELEDDVDITEKIKSKVPKWWNPLIPFPNIVKFSNELKNSNKDIIKWLSYNNPKNGSFKAIEKPKVINLSNKIITDKFNISEFFDVGQNFNLYNIMNILLAKKPDNTNSIKKSGITFYELFKYHKTLPHSSVFLQNKITEKNRYPVWHIDFMKIAFLESKNDLDNIKNILFRLHRLGRNSLNEPSARRSWLGKDDNFIRITTFKKRFLNGDLFVTMTNNKSLVLMDQFDYQEMYGNFRKMGFVTFK